MIRATLVCLINFFNDVSDCKVLNATTDGLMISIRKPKNYQPTFYDLNIPEEAIKAENREGIVKPVHFKELFPELYEELIKKYSVKILRNAQKLLGLHPDK